MRAANKVYIIGIGYKPLDSNAHEVISSADVILASRRILEVFEKYAEFGAVRDKIRVPGNIAETLAYIRDNHQKEMIVLLASGDPLFSGIGRMTINELGKEAVEIFPELSSIQAAFSKIKEPWDDAFLMSLHGGPDPEKRRKLPYEMTGIPALLQIHRKVAILTDRENNPAAIARTIMNSSGLTMFVCERLGYQDEKITQAAPGEIAAMSFPEPNVVIIIKDTETRTSAPGFGLTEKEILHSRGLITKDEVRAVTLHKLRLPAEGVLWDIGAGSGSVSIEAAGLCPGLRIFAFEKDKEQVENIKQNRTRFGTPRIEIIEGAAPEALKGAPSPDRVFIGGSSGQLKGIVHRIGERMHSGIIVINAATIDTLHAAIQQLESAGFSTEVSQVSLSRSKIINGRMHMSALNPVFIITGERD